MNRVVFLESLLRLRELAMVSSAVVKKLYDSETRRGVVRSLRRWLEKQKGMNRQGVRNALGGNPSFGQITTDAQAQLMTRQSYLRRLKEKRARRGYVGPEAPEDKFAVSMRDLQMARRAGKNKKYQRMTGNAPGYIRGTGKQPKLVSVNDEPSILTYRGVGVRDGRAGVSQVKQMLQRPRAAWRGSIANQLTPGRSATQTGSIKQQRDSRGGLTTQGTAPSGAAISTSTNPAEAKSWATRRGDNFEYGAVGAYGVKIRDLIAAARGGHLSAGKPKIALGNARYPDEREISMINGGNILAARKLKMVKEGELKRAF